jgi:hypothetical protein
MNTLKSFSLAAAVAVAAFTVPLAQAQYEDEPACPYGYYDYAPYACAPYGYYGPEWFLGGVFIGAGPWFHGHHDFRGHVDHHYDVNRGYHGALPERGEPRDPANHLDHMDHFGGTEMHDGRGGGFGGGHEGGFGGGHEGGFGGGHGGGGHR